MDRYNSSTRENAVCWNRNGRNVVHISLLLSQEHMYRHTVLFMHISGTNLYSSLRATLQQVANGIYLYSIQEVPDLLVSQECGHTSKMSNTFITDNIVAVIWSTFSP